MRSHFWFSGPPKYLYPLGTYTKGDRAPYTTTHMQAHGHQHVGILLAGSACEQKVTAPQCAFHNFPNSLCTLPPCICSPGAQGEKWAWCEEKGGSILTATYVATSIPGFFTWRTKSVAFPSLTLSNSITAISHDQPFSHLIVKKIQEARLLTHLSLHNEYFLNIYCQSSIPSSTPSPVHTWCHLSKRGLGILVTPIKAIQGPRGRLIWMGQFAKTINLLKPQTREIPIALSSVAWKRVESLQVEQSCSQDLPSSQWMECWS